MCAGTVEAPEKEGGRKFEISMDRMGELFAWLAIIPDAQPDWIRETNIDEAEILIFGEWEDGQILTIQGPTRGTLKAFLSAQEMSGAEAGTNDDMTVRLIREVILEMPGDLCFRRPFVVDGTVWGKKGDRYPSPEDLFQNRPEGVNDDAAEKAVKRYILDFLPHRLILQVTAGAVSLGTPDLSKAFMIAKDKKGGADPLSKGSDGTLEGAG